VPLVPEEPDVPAVPLVPEEPFVPDVPAVPLDPEVPEEPSPPDAPARFTCHALYVPLPTTVDGASNCNTPVDGLYDITTDC
jgi:hypothetical protein